MEQELGIQPGETTPDYRVTCEVVYCLGSCGLAPVAVVNEQVVGKIAPETMAAILKSLE
jgi:NADH-quinone oxidoreductase subunit E